MDIDLVRLKKQLILHEGYKEVAYFDTMHYLTGGIGHLITPIDQKTTGPYLNGTLISKEQIEQWFESDITRAINIAEHYLDKVPIDPIRKLAIVDMAFQLGDGLRLFNELRAALLIKKYDLAVNAMTHSLWFRQTPQRVQDLTDIIKNGV